MLGPPIMQLQTPQLVLRALQLHQPRSCADSRLWGCMGSQHVAAPVKLLLAAAIYEAADDKAVAPGVHSLPTCWRMHL